jgi:hypothetical protein
MLSWSKRLIVPALLTLGFAALGAVPAHAATPDLTCSFNSAYLLFGSPLQAGGQANVYGTGALSGCTSSDGYGSLAGGPVEFLGTATAAPGVDPCSLVLDIQGTAYVNWSGGGTSVLDVTVSTNPADPPLGIGVKVTSGPLDGDTASVVPVLVPNLDCPLVGLDSLTAPAFLISFGS